LQFAIAKTSAGFPAKAPQECSVESPIWFVDWSAIAGKGEFDELVRALLEEKGLPNCKNENHKNLCLPFNEKDKRVVLAILRCSRILNASFLMVN
jgi:hypothetical protein